MLGFRVGRGTRMVDPSKAEALRNWPAPQSTEDLNSFLAFANFIKDFIPSFHDHVRHLRPYVKKGVKFNAFHNDVAAKTAFC